MNAQTTTAVKGGAGSMSTPTNNLNEVTTQNRRSSQEGTLFSGLRNQKRSSSDAASIARRQSFADQAPKAGFVGKMWESFVKGP
ncbi:hypothetical protein SBOR_0755 [Sclerotinia borealis F-4128]|uniref:Conidiation-specific protein 8 n=1 Tax=Sclerotinia borealis (strain F-4128) TaxID=1432307 RepID=W9CQ24_SCLBF|nr:hypothetical protein SBOR_0755 [Sclerotinia borealis F-4128]